MDEATFRFILSNQQKWAEEYRKQKKNERKEYNESVKDKKWYGNTKEYRKLWGKKGAMFYK